MNKIGMMCRYDNSGVGTLSWEFARHIKPHKIWLVQNNVYELFPERYKDFDTQKLEQFPNQKQLDWFFGDIDVFFTIETPYNWSLIKEARKRGVKTILYTMFEMTPDPIPLHFDLYLCPSKLDYDVMPEPKVYVPVPVATDRLKWKERTVAKRFIHSASHGGVNGRKGTKLLLDAMQYVKSRDIELVIYTWKNTFSTHDPRVIIKQVNFQNYWQMWREGDVLVYPQDYNGICLPIIEAMSCGLAVITTDLYPFNEYMPKNLLFQPDEFYMTRASTKLKEALAGKINPRAIADKIDQIANQDISKYSQYGKKWAEENSWDKLKPIYDKIFQNPDMQGLQELKP